MDDSPSPQPGRPQRVETILLDAGGVLLDLDFAFIRRLLEAQCLAIEEPRIARAEARARAEIHRRVQAGGRTRDAWRDYFHILLAQAGLPGERHETVIDTLWEAHQRFGLWTVKIDGAVETVRKLGGDGYRLGVVSNAEGNAARDLDAAGFEGLFEVVIDSHVVGVEKPDPEIFRIALERLEADSATTIYVGDVPAVDVEGARAAGLTPVLLDRHEIYPEPGVPRLTSIQELPGWLQS